MLVLKIKTNHIWSRGSSGSSDTGPCAIHHTLSAICYTQCYTLRVVESLELVSCFVPLDIVLDVTRLSSYGFWLRIWGDTCGGLREFTIEAF